MDKGRIPGVQKRSMGEAIELSSQHLRRSLQTNLLLCSECALKDFRHINGTSEGTDQTNRTALPNQYRYVISLGCVIK